MILSGIGSMIGGLLGMGSEYLKAHLERENKKLDMQIENERHKNELEMAQKQFEYTKEIEKTKLEEIRISADAGVEAERMKTIAEVYNVKTGNMFVDAFNAMVRPVIGYYAITIHLIWGLACIYCVLNSVLPKDDDFVTLWISLTAEMITGVVAFYYVKRSLEKR